MQKETMYIIILQHTIIVYCNFLRIIEIDDGESSVQLKTTIRDRIGANDYYTSLPDRASPRLWKLGHASDNIPFPYPPVEEYPNSSSRHVHPNGAPMTIPWTQHHCARAPHVSMNAIHVQFQRYPKHDRPRPHGYNILTIKCARANID